MKETKPKLLALTGVCLLTAWASQANLIVNGGFESGDFTGWTLSGNLNFAGIVSFFPPFVHTGNYAAQFGAVGSQTLLSQQQVIATVPGTAYQIDFWLQYNTYPGTASPVNLFTLDWDGSQIFSQANVSPSGWREFSFQLTATADFTPIRFGFQNNNSFTEFDDVNLVAAPGSAVALPEASTTYAGAGLALALVGTFVFGTRRGTRPNPVNTNPTHTS